MRSSLEFRSPPREFAHDLRRFLEFGQWLKLAADVGPIQFAGLTNDDPLHVQSVFGAGSGAEDLNHGTQPS